jgi:4-amino-4-deoxy-L-arabinose transferase-like glycosyltransferase
MALNKRNINNFFYIFITIHLLVWTLVPSLSNNNLPLDTIEALAWGSDLEWGYSKHPPMSAFFVDVFYQIFGKNDLVYYLLSQIFVVSSFFIIFKFANKIFKNQILSLLSVLLLEGISFYNFTTPEFNVNICQLPFWSLCVYYAWKVLDEKKLAFKDCLLLGIFAAIGFLSKYLFIYLLISIDLLFFYLIFIKKSKKFDFKYLLSLEVFLVLLIPHLIWLYNNDYITIIYAFARTGLETSNFLNHLTNPLIFLAKQTGILIPIFVMTYFLIKKFSFKINLKDKKLLFLIFINIVPFGLILLTSIISGSKIRTMWMTPFYLFIGVLIIYIFQSKINLKKLNNFISVFIILFIFSPFAYFYISIKKTDQRTDYPGKLIAEKIQYKWNNDHEEPINIVLGNEWNAGNLSYHLKSRPVWEGEVTKEKLDKLLKFTCINDICVGIK